VNLVKWVISIAIMPMIVGWTLSCRLTQGDAALWLQQMGPNTSVAAMHCLRSSWSCETGK